MQKNENKQFLVIIAGMPATGKSTLAKKISHQLSAPILEKDEIKEELFDTVGYKDLTEKRMLDRAATAVLLRCTEAILSSGDSLIIVNNFESNMSETVSSMIDRCGCSAVTVFLGGDADVLHQRYVERDKRHSRHQGHTFIDRYPPLPGDDVDRSMTREYFRDRFENSGMADFKIGGARIEVDATYPDKIDVDALVCAIKSALEVQNEKKHRA